MTSQNAAILALLRARAGQWVPMPELAAVSGAYAVHSRIADLREDGHEIENQVDRSARPCRSAYRLVIRQPELAL